MMLSILITRLQANYTILNGLYKQGKFEDEVDVTENIEDVDKFYFVPTKDLEIKHESASGDLNSEPLGRKRNPRDLQWAMNNLRELAQYLFEKYRNVELSSEEIRFVILYYYRALSLSYEVDDYFLSVTNRTSDFLIGLTKEIMSDVDRYASRYEPVFSKNSEKYQELVKQILIAALCGANECYRKHSYKDGLIMVKEIKKSLYENRMRRRGKSKDQWLGLKGLCAYITGKIHTALGNFTESEQEFRYSVEAYSESVRQKERLFSVYQDSIKGLESKFRKGLISETDYHKKLREFDTQKQEYELSRAVALRRSGLSSSFGYGFQALVMGKVKDAIRLNSMARGVVNWNTGKIYSSYVDLLYYSAKRAENSHDRKTLLEIQRNLKRCYQVFQDLIPGAHYKYRALFQLSIIYHYLARLHRENALKLLSEGNSGKNSDKHFRKARYYWNLAIKHLESIINDQKILPNKRLRAESVAILGHALSNLALLEKQFGHDGLRMIEYALNLLGDAWNEAVEYPQIRCEVGLAQAAVGKVKAEYFLKQSPVDDIFDPVKTKETFLNETTLAEIRAILKNATRTLHTVLNLNRNNSVRIQATAFLRLTEIAMMQKDTRIMARDYYNEYRKIETQVEHDFCHRWALELENKILKLDNSFTFTIVPSREFDKQTFDKKVEDFYRNYAVNFAAKEIEQDFAENNINKRNSLSSYISSALFDNFGIGPKTSRIWIEKYEMFDHLRRICRFAEDLPEYALQSKKNGEKAEL